MCATQKVGRCILGAAAAEGRGPTAYYHNLWAHYGGTSVHVFILVPVM